MLEWIYKKKTGLISDVEPFHVPWPGYYLNISSNCQSFIADAKGSSMKIRPERAFCTCNSKIEVWAGTICCAIDMRFDNIYLDENNKLHVFKRQIIKPSSQFISVLREITMYQRWFRRSPALNRRLRRRRIYRRSIRIQWVIFSRLRFKRNLETKYVSFKDINYYALSVSVYADESAGTGSA